MSETHEVTFAESAVADLEDLREWYHEQGVPSVGERMLRDIFAQVERLADFPASGRVVPEFGIEPLREVIFPPFRIVYRLDESRVRVVRVWRSERLMDMP